MAKAITNKYDCLFEKNFNLTKIGTLTKANNEKYFGNFKNGLRSGKGMKTK